jgi:hypothetical protein
MRMPAPQPSHQNHQNHHGHQDQQERSAWRGNTEATFSGKFLSTLGLCRLRM